LWADLFHVTVLVCGWISWLGYRLPGESSFRPESAYEFEHF